MPKRPCELCGSTFNIWQRGCTCLNHRSKTYEHWHHLCAECAFETKPHRNELTYNNPRCHGDLAAFIAWKGLTRGS